MFRGTLLAQTALSSVFAASLLIASPGHAQTAATGPTTAQTAEEEEAAKTAAAQAEVEGEEITVTATRTQTAVSDVPASISILSGERLEEQLAVSVDLNDVLTKAVPGLAANNERGFSNGRGPLLRGRPASVLINGVPVNQLQRSSGFDLGLIDPMAIERIEVNRGASAVFGFGASGGIINAITRRARGTTPTVVARTQLSFSPNDFDDGLTMKAYAGGGMKTAGGIDVYVGGGVSRVGAAIDPKGNIVDSQKVNIYNLDANVGYEWSNGSALRASGNFFRRNFRADYETPGYLFGSCVTDDCDTIVGGLDPRVAINSPEQNVDDQYQRNYVASLNYSHPDVFGSVLDVTAYAQRNDFQYQDIVSDFGAPPTLSYRVNDQDNKRIGFRSNLTTTVNMGRDSALALTYGFDYLRDSMIRTWIFSRGPATLPLTFSPAPSLTTYQNTPFETRPLAPPIILNSYAGFVQAKFEAGPLIVQGGARHEEFRGRSPGYVVKDLFGAGRDLVYSKGSLPKFNATLYNAGVVYSFNDDAEVFAGLSQGLEITELGRAFRGQGNATTPANPANVNAQPAKTTQYELGMRARINQLRVTASGYYSNAPLSSQLVQVSPLLPLVPLRQPERIWGFEATADYRISSQLTAGGVFTYQNGKYEDEDGNKFDLQNDRVTPTRLTAYVDYNPSRVLGLRVQGTQIFDRSQFEGSPPVVFGTSEGNVDGYFVLDALATAKIGPGEFTAGVENLLNNSYVVAERQAFNDFFDYYRAEGTRVTFGYQLRF